MPLSAYKKQAKNRLAARKIRAARIILWMICTAAFFSVSSFSVPVFIPKESANPLWTLCIQILLLLVSFGLLGAIRQGTDAWLYRNACGAEPSAVQFLYWLRKGRGYRAAALHAAIFCRKAAWTILLCAPGAIIFAVAKKYPQLEIKPIPYITWIGGTGCLLIGLFFSVLICQKYALASIWFARTPQDSIHTTIRKSSEMMDNACIRLLLLKLSFLPWSIVCLTVFPLIYVVPYYRQTTTCMLRDVLQSHVSGSSCAE